MERPMRTTIDLNDTLLARAKAAAVRQRTTLTRLIEEGLELRLRGAVSEPKASRVRLPVYNGKGGLAPGVDPLSNRSLFDAADEDVGG
jgi:hypothetical protein